MMATTNGCVRENVRRALLATMIFAAMSSAVSAQESAERQRRVDWLQANAAPIRSLNPADNNFDDLAPLGAAIGNARVVMLGEQSHGDGAVFLAKTRMIRYLHEKLGFDVLAFESGFYDVPKAWSFLKSGEDPEQAVKRGVFSIWTGSQQVQPLIAYLGQQAKTARPLELTGFDNQFTASASRDFFTSDLRAFLGTSHIDTSTVPEWNRLTPILTRLSSGEYTATRLSADEHAAFTAAWSALRGRIDAIATPDTGVRYWRQVLRSVEAWVSQARQRVPGTKQNAVTSMRDVQMAENLLWLAQEKYPQRKIIVWAATFHIMRNPGTINTGYQSPIDYRGTTTMGHVVARTLGNQAYALGFIASQGRAGPWTGPPRELTLPRPESLEGLFKSTRHVNAFVNLRGLTGDAVWLQSQLTAGPLGYQPLTADWTQVLDGMVYTHTMTPSQPR